MVCSKLSIPVYYVCSFLALSKICAVTSTDSLINIISIKILVMGSGSFQPFGGKPASSSFVQQPGNSLAQSRNIIQSLEGYEWIKDEVGGGCGEEMDVVDEDEMKELPHRHLGVVMAVHQCGVYQVGTGILISKNLVLTCAHVTHCKYYQNKPFQRMYFYPRQHGRLSNYIEVENEETPEEYMSEEKWLFRKVYDYTLLKLKENVNDSGFLPLSGDLPQLDENTTLSIFGYPESKYDKKSKIPVGVKQYGLTKTGHIMDVYPEAGYMVHRISTEAGQSGAPVIKIEDNGAMVIVGVHVGTPEEETNKYQEEFPELKKVNLTKLTNKLMVERLRKFAMKLKGEMFKVREIVAMEGKTLWEQEQVKMKQWEKEKREKEMKERQLEKEKEQMKKQWEKEKKEKEMKERQLEKEKEQMKKQWEKEKKEKEMKERQLEKEKDELFLEIQKLKQEKGYTTVKAANKTKEDQFEEGKEHLIAGRYQQAVESLQKVIEIDPEDAAAYHNMGIALNQLGRREEAVASYKKAIDIWPECATAYQGMGIALYQLDRNEEAVASYKKAIEIDPKDTKAYNNMGIALCSLGRNEEAVVSYKKAIEIDPKHANAYSYMGNALKHLGRFDEAVTSFHKAIQLSHNVRNTYENLESLLLNKLKTTGRLAESVKFLEGIITQHPDNQRARVTAEALKAELEKHPK